MNYDIKYAMIREVSIIPLEGHYLSWGVFKEVLSSPLFFSLSISAHSVENLFPFCLGSLFILLEQRTRRFRQRHLSQKYSFNVSRFR